MLLTADIGNSHTVFGLFKDQTLLATERIESDQPGQHWQKKLLPMLRPYKKVGQCLYASVVPKSSETLVDTLKKIGISKVRAIDADFTLGFQFNYGDKSNICTLGTDRLANVAAATSFYGPDVIVADFGTAITFCLVIDNVYQGGLIAPGVHTALKSLFNNTAQLPQVSYRNSLSALGKDTKSSIEAGVYFSIKGAVTEILSAYEGHDLAKEKTIQKIATGAIAESFAFANDKFDVIDKNLTLRGLMRLAQLN